MIPLVTSSEMRTIEATLVDNGVMIEEMIQRAGRALAERVQEAVPNGAILVLVGPGNNGSDGVAAAKFLQGMGRDVVVYTFRRTGLSGYSGPFHSVEGDSEYSRLHELLGHRSVVIDALLGSGQNRAPEGQLRGIIGNINSRGPGVELVLAADIPTGVDADSGAVLGEAVRCTATLCMGFAKRGAVVYPGAEYAGTMLIADLGMPRRLGDGLLAFTPRDEDIAVMLPRREADSNKGSFGRLLIIGGSRDFTGAPALAATSAYRVGAGLVEIAVPRSAHPVVAAHTLEAVFSPVADEKGQIAPEATPTLREAMTKAAAVALGPGMGLSAGTQQVTAAIVKEASARKLPLLVDADGLNALSRLGEWWPLENPTVLTPHPGEMGRLTGLSVSEVQSNRLAVATTHARRWNCVVVLKGAGTVVADPSGRISVNPTGGPNLAVAGTGDVLSGAIGGLLAQGASAWDAAVAGAYLHGRAGDTVAARLGDAGTLASDLPGELPIARRAILEKGKAT